MLASLASLLGSPKVLSTVGDFVAGAIEKGAPLLTSKIRDWTGASKVVNMPGTPLLPPPNTANSLTEVVVPNSHLNKAIIPMTSMSLMQRPDIRHETDEEYEKRKAGQARGEWEENVERYGRENIERMMNVPPKDRLRIALRQVRAYNKSKKKLLDGIY